MQQERPFGVQKSDLEADMGIVTLFNTSHIDFDKSTKEAFDEQLTAISKQNFNLFISQLVDLKNSIDEQRDAKKLELQFHEFDKPMNNVELPEPVTIFPRFHPLPKKKALTKWEKYAKERGLVKKKKRSKLIFDEVSKDWVHRYGAKGINKVREKYDVVREVKRGDDPYVNPWETEKNEKKLKRQKQEMAQIKNKLRAKGQSIKDAQTYDQKMQKIEQRKTKLKELKMKKKKQLGKSLLVAQNSTASLGKFDHSVSKQEVHRKIRKRKQKVNINGTKQEVERNKEMLKMLSGRR